MAEAEGLEGIDRAVVFAADLGAGDVGHRVLTHLAFQGLEADVAAGDGFNQRAADHGAILEVEDVGRGRGLGTHQAADEQQSGE
jgi:hypothetical protein